MTELPAASLARTEPATELQSKWAWFLALGLVLLLCGAVAVALPAMSTFAASVVFGAALAFAGVFKMIQSFQVKEWSGFVWQELTGAVEFVGGILVYLNPLKGALAITLLIALVLFIEGLMQIALAYKVRKQPGWPWLLLSGLVALAASASLFIKAPWSRTWTPGIVAGVALLIAGVAHVGVAFMVRKAR